MDISYDFADEPTDIRIILCKYVIPDLVNMVFTYCELTPYFDYVPDFFSLYPQSHQPDELVMFTFALHPESYQPSGSVNLRKSFL